VNGSRLRGLDGTRITAPCVMGYYGSGYGTALYRVATDEAQWAFPVYWVYGPRT
jgi:hypothetical protein